MYLIFELNPLLMLNTDQVLYGMSYDYCIKLHSAYKCLPSICKYSPNWSIFVISVINLTIDGRIEDDRT